MKLLHCDHCSHTSVEHWLGRCKCLSYTWPVVISAYWISSHKFSPVLHNYNVNNFALSIRDQNNSLDKKAWCFCLVSFVWSMTRNASCWIKMIKEQLVCGFFHEIGLKCSYGDIFGTIWKRFSKCCFFTKRLDLIPL